MKEWAKPSCKRCYGRGYVGIDVLTSEYIICGCIRKNMTKTMNPDFAGEKEVVSNNEGIKTGK